MKQICKEIYKNSRGREELLNLIIRSYSESEYEILDYVVHEPICPSCVLERLSNHYFWGIRSYVAAHHNTSITTLIKLSKDVVDEVRENIAKNPNTPDYIIEILKTDPDPLVRQIANS